MSDPIPELKTVVEEAIKNTADHAEWMLDFVGRLSEVDELDYGSDIVGQVLNDWLEFERRDAKASQVAARGKKAVNALRLLGDESLIGRFDMALIAVIIAHAQVQRHAARLKRLIDVHRNQK